MSNKKISELTAATAPSETDVMPIVQAAATKKATVSAWVRGALLTGLSTATNAAIAATDSVIVAFGKAQAQIAAILASLNNHIGNTTNAHGMTTPGAAIVQAATEADQRAALGLANHQLLSVTSRGTTRITAGLRASGGVSSADAFAAAHMIIDSPVGAGCARIIAVSEIGDLGYPIRAQQYGGDFIIGGDGGSGELVVSGNFRPFNDNTYSFGTAARRASVVYAASGTINTSDAREKTSVTALSAAEIQAAKMLAAEIGTYKWLASIEAKGAAARKHIGMTVQRAIEIMESCGLDPFKYGFICFDEWGAVENEDGEITQEAGNRYSFRPDELLLFIARGFEARLAALEAK